MIENIPTKLNWRVDRNWKGVTDKIKKIMNNYSSKVLGFMIFYFSLSLS